jgi:hypothetical protein
MSTMCVMVVSVMVLGWLRFTGAATPVPRNSQAENIKWKNVDIAFPDDLDVRTVPRQNYMSQYHHHHHNPDLLPHHHHHHHHFGDDDNDNFEGETLEVDAPENKSGSNTSLQVDLINLIKLIFCSTLSEFENFLLCERILINVTTCQNETSS